MQKTSKFLSDYRLFSFAIVAILVTLALQILGYHVAAKWVLSIAALIEVIPLLNDMYKSLRSGTYGIDLLAATAIIASVILGQHWAAIVIVLMLTGGEALEDYAERRAKSELNELLKNAPQTAKVIRKNKTIEVKVDDIHINDKIVIDAGDLVPVDAVIIEGSASFNESSLTGESLPQPKDVKSKLLSGSVNLDGSVIAKALATAENSQYQQIVRLVQSAQASQAPFVRLADRYSIPFTFGAFTLALGVWIISGDPIRFLEVIVVATPCPLILAAPIALMSGMGLASRYGIIVKTGSALEKLAEAKTIAFDKTGTLTSGELIVDKIQTFGSLNRKEVLSIAASLEQNSNHILASAIVKSAKEEGAKLIKAKNIKEIAGLGLKATIKGQEIIIGRYNFMEQEGLAKPKGLKVESIKQTAAFVAVDGEIVGLITVNDQVRKESKSTVARLKELGIKNILMVTGDNQSVAKKIASQLGITEIHANTLPADKLRIVEGIKKRPVAFVGDGVNDAPVLTASDVGIALGAKGAPAASESADMVIMLDDVKRVAVATHIAKQTFSIAKQSIFIGIGLSTALMVVFATGKFTALSGALVQEVVDVVVIFNALRAHIIKVN
ncbi:MAG: heavy metal translocating P-type ATPase [bacterium]